MDITITIKDAGGAGEPTVSIVGPDELAATGAAAGDMPGGAARVRVPAAGASMAGIDAGPAPAGLAAGGGRGPQAFVGHDPAESASASAADAGDAQSAGAAPTL